MSVADGGVGGVHDAWIGKQRDLGGGDAGAVEGVTAATNGVYVGTSTDTGHSIPGGAVALNPDHTLNWSLIRDFAQDGIHSGRGATRSPRSRKGEDKRTRKPAGSPRWASRARRGAVENTARGATKSRKAA